MSLLPIALGATRAGAPTGGRPCPCFPSPPAPLVRHTHEKEEGLSVALARPPRPPLFSGCATRRRLRPRSTSCQISQAGRGRRARASAPASVIGGRARSDAHTHAPATPRRAAAPTRARCPARRRSLAPPSSSCLPPKKPQTPRSCRPHPAPPNNNPSEPIYTVGRLARVLDLLGRGGRRARRDRHARRPRLGASCARSAAAARRPTARAPHPAVPLPAARARAVLGAMAAAVGRDAVSPLVFVSLPRALVLSFLVASPLTPRLPLKKNPQPNTAASTTATFAPADCPSGATSSPPSADAPPRPS